MRRDDRTFVSEMLDRCLRMERLVSGLDFGIVWDVASVEVPSLVDVLQPLAVDP